MMAKPRIVSSHSGHENQMGAFWFVIAFALIAATLILNPMPAMADESDSTITRDEAYALYSQVLGDASAWQSRNPSMAMLISDGFSDYCVYDLDGDGIPELIQYNDADLFSICCAYTINNKKLVYLGEVEKLPDQPFCSANDKRLMISGSTMSGNYSIELVELSSAGSLEAETIYYGEDRVAYESARANLEPSQLTSAHVANKQLLIDALAGLPEGQSGGNQQPGGDDAFVVNTPYFEIRVPESWGEVDYEVDESFHYAGMNFAYCYMTTVRVADGQFKVTCISDAFSWQGLYESRRIGESSLLPGFYVSAATSSYADYDAQIEYPLASQMDEIASFVTVKSMPANRSDVDFTANAKLFAEAFYDDWVFEDDSMKQRQGSANKRALLFTEPDSQLYQELSSGKPGTRGYKGVATSFQGVDVQRKGPYEYQVSVKWYGTQNDLTKEQYQKMIANGPYTTTFTLKYSGAGYVSDMREESANTPQQQQQSKPAASTQTMYRLYNRWSGEHLFTSNKSEYNVLGDIGWIREGEAWKSPTSGTAVYRLYNSWSGDHHYTTSASEYNTLGRIGWTQEGVAFYSGGSTKVYRGFNPYETIGTHHYTTDKPEMDTMVSNGWVAEGVGWYCM